MHLSLPLSNRNRKYDRRKQRQTQNSFSVFEVKSLRKQRKAHYFVIEQAIVHIDLPLISCHNILPTLERVCERDALNINKEQFFYVGVYRKHLLVRGCIDNGNSGDFLHGIYGF